MSRPRSSAVLRSADPDPWAIHLPPQARRIGSRADTMPETGGTQTTRLPTYWCKYGSRLATTKSWCPLNRSRISCCRASLFHMAVLRSVASEPLIGTSGARARRANGRRGDPAGRWERILLPVPHDRAAASFPRRPDRAGHHLVPVLLVRDLDLVVGLQVGQLRLLVVQPHLGVRRDVDGPALPGVVRHHKLVLVGRDALDLALGVRRVGRGHEGEDEGEGQDGGEPTQDTGHGTTSLEMGNSDARTVTRRPGAARCGSRSSSLLDASR